MFRRLAARDGESSPSDEFVSAPVVERGQSLTREVQTAPESRPTRAVPLRNIPDEDPAREREPSSGVERGPGSIVEHFQCFNVGVRADSERRPSRAIPLGDVARRNSVGKLEAPRSDEPRSVAVVEDAHRIDPRAEVRRTIQRAYHEPIRAVPLSYVLGRRASCLREVSGYVECVAPTVVKHGQVIDD